MSAAALIAQMDGNLNGLAAQLRVPQLATFQGMGTRTKAVALAGMYRSAGELRKADYLMTVAAELRKAR